MTIRLYSWDDASAPSLTGASNSIITLLDAVLVNGYGSQTAAGWTKPYTGTGKAAYKNATLGHYVRIVDNGDTNRSFRFRGYITMSDVDTGTDPFPSVAQMAGDGLFYVKSQSSNSTAHP